MVVVGGGPSRKPGPQTMGAGGAAKAGEVDPTCHGGLMSWGAYGMEGGGGGLMAKKRTPHIPTS